MSHAIELRLSRVRRRLLEEDLAALVVLGEADCRYLTGFSGETASVCLTPDDVVLFTDPRYEIQAGEQAPLARLVVFSEGRDDLLPAVMAEILAGSKHGSHVLGVDSTWLTVNRWDKLRPKLDEAGVQWRLVSDIVETCRQVKFPDELAAIRAAAALATRAFQYLEGRQVVGRAERDVALDIEVFLRENGSEGVAFPFIVAAGERGAMPHAEASNALIEPGQLVVFDLGTMVDGYASDVTRTYATGPIDDDLIAAYAMVREAQASAVAAAKAGVPCKDLDALARGHLAGGGLAQLFVHSLGHGVGLEVHEGPNLSQRSESILESGMVVTIEPGVYFPNRGGIRIEDTIIIHGGAAEVITDWPRELRFLS
ncbi:MAG TPA: aminopeptidase P family protein [Thermoleophilia bacterium]|nr:aminopeptidase P family protein [Thermoleophilia bacterium]